MSVTSSLCSNSVSGSDAGRSPLCCSSSNESVGARRRPRCQSVPALRTILRNHARPFPPVYVRKYRNARSDASCTTSSASCSFRISRRASRCAAGRWGSTTSSKLSSAASAVTGRDRALLMDRLEDLVESLFERGIPIAEADPAEPDVREHRVGAHIVGQYGTDHEAGRRPGHSKYAQRTVREAGECFGKLVQEDRVAVDEEVPAADFTVFGKVQ